MRIGSSALLLLSLALAAAPARAISFGTSSTALIDLPGDGLDGAASEQTVDTPVSPSSAWLTDGTTTAGALTPFGTNNAEVASAAGTSAFAASLWIETFTLASDVGATGTALVEFRIAFTGTLDAGVAPGGFAQATYRSFVGLPGPDDALAPAVLLAAASAVFEDACASELCADPAQAASDLLVLQAELEYGVAYRMGALLELVAWNGGAASFLPGGALVGVALPHGGRLAAASQRDYSALYASVPEPGTLALLGAGLAALVRRRRSGASKRSPKP